MIVLGFGELLEHRGPRQGGRLCRLPAGLAGQRPERGTRRPRAASSGSRPAPRPRSGWSTSSLERLEPRQGVEVVHTTDEDEYFPPPPELRDLLRWLGVAAGLALGAPGDGGPPTATDRQVTATGMLIRTRPPRRSTRPLSLLRPEPARSGRRGRRRAALPRPTRAPARARQIPRTGSGGHRDPGTPRQHNGEHHQEHDHHGRPARRKAAHGWRANNAPAVRAAIAVAPVWAVEAAP